MSMCAQRSLVNCLATIHSKHLKLHKRNPLIIHDAIYLNSISRSIPRRRAAQLAILKTLPTSKNKHRHYQISASNSRDEASTTQENNPQPTSSDDETKESPEDNGIGGMLSLAIPALGIVLADPLQSLVDTAFMGQLSMRYLAALGPNTAIFNFVFFTFAFLGIATSNLVASNSITVEGLSKEEKAERRNIAETTLCNALTISIACGIGACVLLRTYGKEFIVAMGAAPELVADAVTYCSLRAFAVPAALVICVLQGARLGQQDAYTPMYVCLSAGFLSFLGDIVLILGAGWGLRGAAVATVAAQYTAAIGFGLVSWRKGRYESESNIALTWKGWPRVAEMKAFIKIGIAVLSRHIFGMAAFFAMTVSATKLGTLCTAAHQIAMQTFWFLSFFPEPISLAAQSLIARDKENPAQARHWAWLMLKAGAIAGCVLSIGVVGMFLQGAKVFTSDAVILGMVGNLTPIGGLAMIICGVMMALDGISLGSGRFQHLAPSNALGLSVTLGLLELGRRYDLGLNAVWWAQAAFYGARVLGHFVSFGLNWNNSVFVRENNDEFGSLAL